MFIFHVLYVEEQEADEVVRYFSAHSASNQLEPSRRIKWTRELTIEVRQHLVHHFVPRFLDVLDVVIRLDLVWLALIAGRAALQKEDGTHRSSRIEWHFFLVIFRFRFCVFLVFSL